MLSHRDETRGDGDQRGRADTGRRGPRTRANSRASSGAGTVLPECDVAPARVGHQHQRPGPPAVVNRERRRRIRRGTQGRAEYVDPLTLPVGQGLTSLS